jgi:hypothetical protein
MPFYKTPDGGIMHAAFPIEGMEETAPLQRAVLVERERCAKIAEMYAHEHTSYCDNFCGEELAKLIRKDP